MNKKAVKKYRKKPIDIEAYQTDKVMYIETLEGTHKADIGDYIITGVNGEQYPCKPDIFEQTYEPVNNANTLKLTCSNNWISVKDRLPEDDNFVLVYNSKDKEIIIANYRGNNAWDSYIYGWLPDDTITYWQPLPELPEVEE